jgi:hypothetical protein
VTRFDLVFAFFLTEILAHVEARLTDAQLAIGIASPQSVLSIITLDMDFANVGALGTKSREQFEFFLTSDLAEASGLKRTKFEVKLVEPGSVVVHAEVRGDVAKGKTSQLVAEDLRMQANNPKSLLRAGQITRKIKSFVIKAGSSTPPATVVHGQQEHKEQLEVRKEQLGTWVENLKQALIVAARARVEAEAEVGSMTTQLEAQDPIEKINQLDLQLEREKEISEKMQEKLKNIKEFESEQMKRAQREVEELKASLLEARQEFQKSEEEAGRLKDRVSRLEALDREQVTVAEELLKSKAKLLQQKKDVESLELRRKEEVAILESQITRLDEVLAAGARRCADQEKEVSRLEARVHEQDIALNDKRDRLHEQETALKNMQKEMSDLSESLTASSEARDMLQQKCHDIQGSCQRQLSELRQQLNRRCASFEADVRQLQQRECELRQQVVDDLPVTGEGKQADFQSQEYLHLESRLDALRCHLHEEEERHTREVLRSNLPFVFC